MVSPLSSSSSTAATYLSTSSTSTGSSSTTISAAASSFASAFSDLLYADVCSSLMTGSSRAMATWVACASSRCAASYRPSFTSSVIMSSTRRVRYERQSPSSLGDFFSGFAFCDMIRYSMPMAAWEYENRVARPVTRASNCWETRAMLAPFPVLARRCARRSLTLVMSSVEWAVSFFCARPAACCVFSASRSVRCFFRCTAAAAMSAVSCSRRCFVTAPKLCLRTPATAETAFLSRGSARVAAPAVFRSELRAPFAVFGLGGARAKVRLTRAWATLLTLANFIAGKRWSSSFISAKGRSAWLLCEGRRTARAIIHGSSVDVAWQPPVASK
mmetsp:Transcript_72446/g.145763  ORF Transcript_72446/g.145763 Transcript_72446/m.145763 type:complete len:330 (-) Transcript_72446:372-1361(-)